MNPYFLHMLLDPLTGLADDDESIGCYADLDSNNEACVRDIIRRTIVPYVEGVSLQCLQGIQLALRLCLTSNIVDFRRVFESTLPPFDPPDDPRLFFLWIWMECFPNESYNISDPENYSVNADPNEPIRLQMKNT